MADPKVMVVTGATSGIGEAAASELAARGHHVVLVARRAERAAATVDRIRARTPAAELEVVFGDLTVMADVRRVAAEILDRHDHLDVLVNNAGINAPKQSVTSEGHAEMMAVNYFAPWLLTALLRERLLASAPARVVTTASEAHRLAWTIDPERDLTSTAPYGSLGSQREYGKTKLLDILFTKELARQLAGTGVTANCCCPGLVNTGLIGDNATAQRLGSALSRTPLIRRPEQGARVLVRLATDPAYATRTGEFVSSTPGARVIPDMPALRDADLQRRVWEATEALLTAPG